jgi:hypothetical protein
MELGPVGIVGFGAFGLMVVLWLVVSFSEPSHRRTLLEWLAATCLYVVLSMFFLSLVLEALEDDSTVRLVAFGFLLFLFGSGCLVSLYNTLRSLGGGGSAQGSATH